MANLLRYLVDLASDDATRERFDADAEAAVAMLEAGVEGGLTADDVVACAAIARRLVDPTAAARLPSVDDLQSDLPAPQGSVLRLLQRWAGRDAESLRGGHLRAVDPPDDDALAGPVVDPEHPAVGDVLRPSLHSVPNPDDARFRVLEMVVLIDGVPDHGVEPGALATVVAVHDEDGLAYEVEVGAADGGRLFLGVVPADRVGPA